MKQVQREVEVTSRDGLHARPAAALAEALAGLDAHVTAANLRTGKPAVALTGPTSVLILGARFGDRLIVTASGRDAGRAIELVERLAADDGDDTDRPAPSRSPVVGLSPGLAVGRVVRMPDPVAEPARREPIDPADERLRLESAMAGVVVQLRERAETARGDAREILEATALLAADQTLLRDAAALVSGGESAERAVWLVLSGFADELASQGGRAAERVVDAHDLRNRVVAVLLGQAAPEVPSAVEPFVLVAAELAPFDVVLLDASTCLALVTEQGGPTSHLAIVARSLGIPAVVAGEAAASLANGTVVFVDGTNGRLEVDPAPQLVATVGQQPSAAVFGGRGSTNDLHSVALLANIDAPDTVADARANNAEGVGLFRTEFCFVERATAPSVDEQVAAYRPVFAAFAGSTVIVRTLDAGADKPLAFVTMSKEPNPALGARGIRTALRNPQLLDDQLEAIARAAQAEKADVRVMAPMIASVDETASFVAACRSHGIAKVGAMVETPAAAVMAAELCTLVDFVSIGTNDLTQYTVAADRELAELAHLADPWQPAVLRLIATTIDACLAAGIPVGVCGEAAADPLAAAVFVGMGASSLSMTPRAIGAVAAGLSGVTQDQCRRAAVAARDASTARAARLAAIAILA